MNLEEYRDVEMRSAAALRLFAGMLAALSLAGCGQLTSRIEAEDNRVFLPAMRAALNLSEGRESPSRPQTGHAVEIGVAGMRGSDSQSLAAGDLPIVLNNTTFSAPQQLRNEFAFYFADVSWRWRKFPGERPLGLEVLAGLGYSSLGLTVSSPTQRASEHFATWGPQAGIGLIWRIEPTTSLQARAAGFLSGSSEGANQATRFELFVAKAFSENLTLRAGYAGWEVRGDDQVGTSDFRLRFSGPVLAIDISAR
jgi:hypothetical protein